MKRIYCLVPDVDTARRISDELLLAKIEARHIHALARDDIDLQGVPEAKLPQRSDLIPAIQKGLALGGGAGLLAGFALLLLPQIALDGLGGPLILGVALAGALFGMLGGSAIGVSVFNSRVKSFEPAVERGEILLMVDVPPVRIDEIKQLIVRHHPEAEFEGVEPRVPAFP